MITPFTPISPYPHPPQTGTEGNPHEVSPQPPKGYTRYLFTGFPVTSQPTALAPRSKKPRSPSLESKANTIKPMPIDLRKHRDQVC